MGIDFAPLHVIEVTENIYTNENITQVSLLCNNGYYTLQLRQGIQNDMSDGKPYFGSEFTVGKVTNLDLSNDAVDPNNIAVNLPPAEFVDSDPDRVLLPIDTFLGKYLVIYR